MKYCICLAIVMMGFSGLAAEILLLRELLIVFSGNELCIGIILANWLMLEAFGCFLAGRSAEKSTHALEIFVLIGLFFSVAVFGAVFLTRILKNLLGVSIGESLGLLPMVYSSLLILLPVSVSHGALFTLSCRMHAMFSGRDGSAAGTVYVCETVGALLGGIVCTYLFIPYLHGFQVATWLALSNLIAGLVALAPARKTGRFRHALLVILGALLGVVGYLALTGRADALHRHSINAQWAPHTVAQYRNSRYGNICVLENQGQYIFFLDGIPTLITPIPDIPAVEEFVHLPLLAHPNPANILIISGGAGGMIHEALKHPSIAAIDYAELDPLLLELVRAFPTPLTESELTDRRVTVAHRDGRLFLNAARHGYDAIFVGVAEPSNLQTNRFFTREFFALAKTRLKTGGILVLRLPGSLTYSNDELQDLNSCIFHTLNRVFAQIRVMPGDGANLFLASDSDDISTLDLPRMVERLEQRNIAADGMAPRHLENALHPGWQDWFARFIEGRSQRINSDFEPRGLFYSLAYWNSLFAPSFGRIFRQFERISVWGVALACGLLMLAHVVVRSKHAGRPVGGGIPFAIATTGFAGMLFDLVVIFAFQSLYGYVFAWIGLLVAAFMAGAACGAMLAARVAPRIRDCSNAFVRLELALVGFALGLPGILLGIHAYQGHPGLFVLFKGLFVAVSGIGGLLVGAQFPLANAICLRERANVSRTAGALYASDLLGGWFGGIVGAVVLLPVLGLVGACLAVALLKLTSFAVISTWPHRSR